MIEGLADPLLLVDRCLIGGRWVGIPQDNVFNPATGEPISWVPHLKSAEAQRAVEAAKAAFKTWSGTTAKQRATVLRRWFEFISQSKEDLARILTSEQGKPLAEARGEMDYAASFVEFYAEEARRVYSETIQSPRTDARIIVTRQPDRRRRDDLRRPRY